MTSFESGDGPVKMYEKAVIAGRSILQKYGRKIDSQIFDGVTWTSNAFGMETGTYERSRTLSFDELMAEAAKYGVSGCGSNEVADLQDLSMDDLVKLKSKDFTLYPLLKEGFYCLIYGGSGVAKTWFALHLAICLSRGQAPFDGWEFRSSTPLNVMYVAGEMKEEEYGDRMRKLLAEQKTNPRFRFIRKDLDLASMEDQERVSKLIEMRKSQVVVLDNLSTLATNGHTEGQFEIIRTFIQSLQNDGIIVLLVHHENREGDFKGSSKIVMVADITLHLFHAGTSGKIELLVQPDKTRSISQTELSAFHTEFDPNKPVSVWPTRELTKEERHRIGEDDSTAKVERNASKKRSDNHIAWRFLDVEDRAISIIDEMLHRDHDDDAGIAETFATSEKEITDFRKQYGISSEALIEHLPEAKEVAKKKSGKITPNELGQIIWNLLKNNKE